MARISSSVVAALLAAAIPTLAARTAQAEDVAEVKEHAAELFEALEKEEHGAAPSPAPEAPPAPAEAPAASFAPAAPAAPAPAPAPAVDPEAKAELEAFIELYWRKRAHANEHRAEVRQAIAEHQAKAAAELTEEEEEAREDAAERAEEEAEDKEDDAPRPQRRWRIGIEGHGSVGVDGLRDGSGELDVVGLGGLDIALGFGNHISVGVGQMSGAFATTNGRERWAIHGAPYLELHFTPGGWLQLYLQAGAALQLGEPRRGDFAHLGFAPMAGGGARFFLGSAFSLGPAVRGLYVMSNELFVSDQALPRGHLIVTAGFDVHLHF